MVTTGIVSLLDIDWASLARSTPSRPATGSLMKRFQPAAVFSEIGISRALVGDNLYNMVQQICSVGGKASGLVPCMLSRY